MWEKEIKRIILGLVWKWRNIGYLDPIYAPSVMASTEALANAKMEMVEKQKKTKLRPQDFEDLVGEANVILVELLYKKKIGLIDDVAGELYAALKSKFQHMYRDLNKYGLTYNNDDYLSVPDETTPYSFIIHQSWKKRLEDENLTPDVKVIASAIINNDKRLQKHIKDGRFSKNALRKFCMKDLGWSDWRFRKAIKHCRHVRF